jgi:hypothetical protein
MSFVQLLHNQRLVRAKHELLATKGNASVVLTVIEICDWPRVFGNWRAVR